MPVGRAVQSALAWALLLASAATAAAGEAGADLSAAFAADCAARAAAAEKAGALAVAGRDGWLFLAGELRHLGAGRFWGGAAAGVSRAADPALADPLPVILDAKRQLNAAGVELLLVPVPAKAAIYPDMLSDRVAAAMAAAASGGGMPGASSSAAAPGAAPPGVDAADREFYDVLRAAGVQVLDLAPVFLAERLSIQGPLFLRQDSHWSGNGCVVAAREIGRTVRDRPWLKERQKAALASEWRAVEVAGDLGPAGGGPLPVGPAVSPAVSPAAEKASVRFVGRRTDGGLEPMPDDRASPIVLMGDSSNLVFHAGGDMYAAGAGLPDQLALELGLPIDVVAVRGSGATAAGLNLSRRIRADMGYLKSKRLVIWCFAAREFTESDGWRALPLIWPAGG
ncbi:MAG: hypothetical protein FJ288_11055 [Planctomycetes bacterium]|nr:hypothetical protein [Planctomycetota bacterium]